MNNLKDYCKNCDVEPPAMRFKCPECEHNPDKEQIICKYKFRNKEKFENLNNRQIVEYTENLIYENSELYINIKEKEQECEELKEECEALKLEIQELWRIKAKSLNEKLELRNTCYRKALEEIEKIVSKNYYDDTWADISIKLDDILNIINNAKGEGKCQ